jgi:hypothetical protein
MPILETFVLGITLAGRTLGQESHAQSVADEKSVETERLHTDQATPLRSGQFHERWQ